MLVPPFPIVRLVRALHSFLPLVSEKQRNCKSRMLGQIVVPSFCTLLPVGSANDGSTRAACPAVRSVIALHDPITSDILGPSLEFEDRDAPEVAILAR